MNNHKKAENLLISFITLWLQVITLWLQDQDGQNVARRSIVWKTPGLHIAVKSAVSWKFCKSYIFIVLVFYDFSVLSRTVRINDSSIQTTYSIVRMVTDY